MGKPEQHEDGSPFTKEDFKAREVDVRSFAYEIASKMHPDLWMYQYDADNKRAVAVTPPSIDFGRPSQANAGASTSAGPSLSTPAAPTPARARLEDGRNSQPQEEEIATIFEDPSAPGSSAANAPLSGEAAPKDSSAQAAGPTPAQKENASVEKDHPLDDY